VESRLGPIEEIEDKAEENCIVLSKEILEVADRLEASLICVVIDGDILLLDARLLANCI
jgi:hypothetical protein